MATCIQVVEKLIGRFGIEAGPLFAQHGIDRGLLSDPSARLSQDAIDALVRDLAARVPDPAFGLLAAECWHPGSLGALGHAWLASSTLRRGLERLQRYWQLLGQRTAITLRDDADGLAVVLRNPRSDPVVAAAITDIEFSVLLDMCRMNAGRDLNPVQVRLIRPEPLATAPYSAFFRCPVRFGAAERAIVLPRAAVDAPLATGNRQIAGLLDRMLAEDLARLDRSDVVARCRAQLHRRLASGEVTATQVASDLAMSRRTLHRKLADAGTTWQQLVDATRRDMALRMIEDPRRAIGEITFELGFSQQSAFARAFRRWAGTSPTQYRESLAAARGAAVRTAQPAL
ncbi:MAG: AraC family transcriptional regulator [Burkholderiales bacterium]|nr:MAG: AraC family transcriptional regulator [Burkholderiales bacterium]